MNEPLKRRSAGLPIGRLVGLIVLLTMVPLALLTGFTLHVASDAMAKEVKARVRSTAAAGAEAVQNELQGLSDLVASYAQRPLLIGGLEAPGRYDREVIRVALSQLQKDRPGIAAALVTAPDGRLIDVVPDTPSIVGKDLSSRDWYRGVTASGRSYVSAAYDSEATGHPRVVAVATLVFAPTASETPGKLLGILVAAYGLDTIQRFVDDFASSQGVSFAVTDQRGVLLAAPMASPGKLLSRAGNPQVAAALRGGSGIATEDTPTGSVLSAYQPVFGLGWTIKASVLERDALEAVGTLRTTLLTVAALLGVALMGGLILLMLSLRGRKRAEEALRASEERTRSIIETAGDALIGMDTSGLITDWNPQAEVLFGWSREEGIGRSVADTLIPARYREAHRKGLERFLATGEGPVLGRRIELSALHRDGHEFPVELSVTPVRLGEALSFNAFVHDISERKQAEETIREGEEKLRAIFAASPDIFTTVGPNGELGQPSPAIYQILGYSPEEYAHMDRRDLVHPEDRERPLEALRALMRGGGAMEIRYRVRHADGRWVTLETRAQAMTDAEGKPHGAVTLSRDVTERVALEEALKQAKEDAERANRAKSEFLSRMSHELRTPLNAVLGFGQLLEMDHLTQEQLESVQQILKGGRHLLDLINEVLDIARIETGRIALSSEPIHVLDALSGALDLVRPLARELSIRIEALESDSSHRYVLADRQRLRQVLLNLLSNAVKYNREGGSVIVCFEAVGEERLRISVTDQGPGIPLDKMHRLFTPFDRLGAEGTGVEGTGLGLALSKRLMEAMGGTLGVESTPGQGSTFTVELPLVESPERQYELSSAGVAALPPMPPGTHRVLHIEDNPANVKLIERVMGTLPNVTVLSAMQGSLGVELARQHRPDVVLLDLNLPDLTGFEALRLLQADPATRDIPVVVVSADATKDQINRLLDAGAQAYLTKPLDVQRFVELIGEILRERRLDRAQQ